MAIFKPTYRDKKTGEVKESKTWWYEFVFNGERIRRSAKTANQRVAEQIEAAAKTQLAKGEVGIATKPPAPTLKEFGPRFEKQIEVDCASKPATVSFYKSKLAFLLKHEPLANCRLDKIDEELIDAYKQARARQVSRRGRRMSPASVNRELATLRRLLWLARSWKVIASVPKIKLQREFVLSYGQEKLYLEMAPPDLKDIAILSLDTGLRIGEALSLEWPQVHLEPVTGASLGYVRILGTRSKNSKPRNVPLTARAVVMLRGRKPQRSGLVFHRGDGSPLYQTWLNQQHSALRVLLKLPVDFVPHSFRHTYGTRLGEAGADAFTIMRLMGHSTVIVSQKYVHPSPEAMERAVQRLEVLNAGSGTDREKKVPQDSPKVEIAEEAKDSLSN